MIFFGCGFASLIVHQNLSLENLTHLLYRYMYYRFFIYLDNFKLLAEIHNKRFNILSTNIESINAKHCEIEAFLEELNRINFKFSLICFQECWISENYDMCHLLLERYQCLKQNM